MTMTMTIETIDNMLNIACGENGPTYFESLNRIHARISKALKLDNVSDFHKCSKLTQIPVLEFCIDDLVIVTPNDEESCHLIAYTLKMIEVKPSPRHFKSKIKFDFKKSISFMIQLLEKETIESFVETKDVEYFEGWRNETAEQWKKIIKLYDDIYNTSFDYIWR
ncbi:hypothetical protein [Peribacillus frigoritolerans]|uniref:hypothetical protein n=1 Tax=Peribacillus frigoritolerans TaxID=450367 RepID=UPI002E224824|nr:hypothetical protein [Peribacillus frigoritolerans]MED3845721.1 hypothetical protein [Peribacillus frigoritolerans]